MKKKVATIGEAIKQARVKMRLSAGDVAASLNVSRSRVFQWEKDNYVFPKNLPALSDTLGIPLNRLKRLNGERRVQN